MRRLRIVVVVLVVLGLVPPGGSISSGVQAAAAGPLGAYRGLGTWVDIYESWAWNHSWKATKRMKSRGVRTLYLETSNWRRPSAILYPGKVGQFLDAAHARGIHVVAWYLPGFARLKRDLHRSMAAIEFESGKGERFDSFALDIEERMVTPVSRRTQRLLTLSRWIRERVGPSYPLGAIIPAPQRMQMLGFWPGFPYQELAKRYDVFLPMGYFTFHFQGGAAAHNYTVANIRIIRTRTGDPTVPIHAIGGVAEDSGPAEVRGFVHAAREHGIIGASLYNFTASSESDWTQMRPVPANPRQDPALPVTLGYPEPLGRIPGEDMSHPKEVFFRVSGREGAWTLAFESFDVAAEEVEVWVNWKRLAVVEASGAAVWGAPQSVLIPDARLHDDRRNYVHFVTEGDFPDWSTWGVRATSLDPA